MRWSSTGSSSSRWRGRLAETITKPEGITQAFNREAVETLAGSDVQWLGEHRLSAWQTYEDTPMPTRQLEEWRYTDADMFKLGKVALAAADSSDVPDAARAMLDRGEMSGHVLTVDGRIVEMALDEELASKGVIFMSLEDAAREHADLVAEHLGSALPATFNKFAALNGALWSGGVFMYVPKGVR